jgi:hypothetical protein
MTVRTEAIIATLIIVAVVYILWFAYATYGIDKLASGSTASAAAKAVAKSVLSPAASHPAAA